MSETSSTCNETFAAIRGDGSRPKCLKPIGADGKHLDGPGTVHDSGDAEWLEDAAGHFEHFKAR